ncbi:MAG TPA: hypothetical protein VMN39_05775, partial [Longimicrobiaceae bacterium]|nr:hypothetical protein [Longimicrobiaceae bacterium]
LLLLETMRDRDRPPEVLEEEDVSTSLPRRLGLSEVVRLQIQKFTQEVKLKRPQVSSQVEDLIRLVIRRPDAEEIFVEAGQQVARWFWSERSGAIRTLVRFLPRPLALITAHRAGRRMFTRLVGPTPFGVSRRPVSLTIDSSLTSRADPGGAACGVYAGAFAELLELYTGRKYRVTHTRCATRAGGPCVWSVEISA